MALSAMPTRCSGVVAATSCARSHTDTHGERGARWESPESAGHDPLAMTGRPRSYVRPGAVDIDDYDGRYEEEEAEENRVHPLSPLSPQNQYAQQLLDSSGGHGEEEEEEDDDDDEDGDWGVSRVSMTVR